MIFTSISFYCDLHEMKWLIWATTEEWKKRRNNNKVKNLFSSVNFIVFIIIIKISKIIITKDIRIKWCILLQKFFELELKAGVAWAQVLFLQKKDRLG